MADLADDPEYIEDCRRAAWADRPHSELLRYWKVGTKQFNFPDGWPDGIQPDAYVRELRARYTPPHSDAPAPPSGPASPSVRRLREMLQ